MPHKPCTRTHQSINQTNKTNQIKSIIQTINQSINQTNKQTNNQSINQSIKSIKSNQSNKQTNKQSINQSINRSIKSNKLHHRRPQTVGGFKKCFGEQGQRHEIAATGLMKMSAKVPQTTLYTFILFGFACFAATLDAEKRRRKHLMGVQVFGSKRSKQAA